MSLSVTPAPFDSFCFWFCLFSFRWWLFLSLFFFFSFVGARGNSYTVSFVSHAQTVPTRDVHLPSVVPSFTFPFLFLFVLHLLGPRSAGLTLGVLCGSRYVLSCMERPNDQDSRLCFVRVSVALRFSFTLK